MQPLSVAAVPQAAESGATLATGAGNDASIPRAFLALSDIAALTIAFVATGVTAPWVQWLLLPSGPLSVSLPAWLSLPEVPGADPFPTLSSVAWILVAMSPMTVLFMELLGGYRTLVDQSRTRLVISCVMSPVVSLSFLTLVFYAIKTSSSSRVFIFTFAATAALALISYRMALRAYKRQRLATGVYAKNVLLIGNPAAVSWMEHHFAEHVPMTKYRIAGWLSLNRATEPDEPGAAQLGLVEDLGKLLVNRPIHEVIAVQSAGERSWLPGVIDDCGYFRVTLRIVPEALMAGNMGDLTLMFRSEPLRLPEVVLAPKHFDSEALFIKRVFDILVSATLLVLLAPVFLLIGIAIKLTTPSLPVFFPWKVIGLKGRPFTGYKFTTMVAGAEGQREALLARNEMQGPVFKVKDDPRVTVLGRFLRKYSLNELPQLWSVLKGDMSLVGPRPAFRHELDRYELWHKRKLCVKPGMTCLWQVSGRNRISNFDDWVRLDLAYIDRWSLWLDFRILVRTLWAVLSGTGS